MKAQEREENRGRRQRRGRSKQAVEGRELARTGYVRAPSLVLQGFLTIH